MKEHLAIIKPIIVLRSLASRVVHTLGCRLAMRQLAAFRQWQDPFVMIVMPGTLHVARLAANYVPPSENLVVILNGVTRWERDWARQNIRCKAFVNVPRTLGHAEVLRTLFDSFEQPFGIMDSDLFVLDPACFSQMKSLAPKASVNAYYYEDNGHPSLKVPMTYFMFFNRSVLQGMRKQYDLELAASYWETLPNEVKTRLASLGFGPNLYPQPHVGYFDTLQVLILMALTEGFAYHCVQNNKDTPKSSDRVFHVGAVSYWANLDCAWKFRGAYFSLRALEQCGDRHLREHYHKTYDSISVSELLSKHPGFQGEIGCAFTEYAEELINRGSRC